MNPCKSPSDSLRFSPSCGWHDIVDILACFSLRGIHPDTNMHRLATLLPDPFTMDCPVTTEGDYISSHVTGFPTDDDDGQRVGALASMPVNNGVRYHAQQPAMQDLQ
jgi:hypothetical protein